MKTKIIDKNNDINNIPKLISTKLIYKGRFISYFIKDFEMINQNKKKITTYETVDYNSRIFNQNEIENEFLGKNAYTIYAVNIIPIIKYSSKPKKLIIVSVFRYPINKFCIEFPAGFMDKTDINKDGKDNFIESIKKSALRELEEETGYKGKFICFSSTFFSKNLNLKEELKIGSNIFFDPWKSSDNAIQCIVEIDGDNILNKNNQKLDDTEFIQVFEVEIEKLMEFINDKMNKEKCGCSCELYNFALGLNFNNILNNTII